MTEISGYLFIFSSACWSYAGYAAITFEQPGYGLMCLALAVWQGRIAYRLFKESV